LKERDREETKGTRDNVKGKQIITRKEREKSKYMKKNKPLGT
jgi:hypothetical protein